MNFVIDVVYLDSPLLQSRGRHIFTSFKEARIERKFESCRYSSGF